MLALDGERIARQKKIEARLLAHEQSKTFMLEQMAGSFVFVDEFDPTDPARQQGRPMTAEAVTALIRRLNPNLAVLYHPTRSNIIVVYKRTADNRLQTVATFGAGVLPEFSIMERREKTVEMPLPLNDEGIEDLSVREFVPEKQRAAVHKEIERIWNDPIKRYDDDDVMRVMEKVLEDHKHESPLHLRLSELGKELVRGWRTVFIRLYQQHLITAAQMERTIGNVDNLAWAVKLGRREAVCPI